MAKDSADQPGLSRFLQFRCEVCGSGRGYRSRPRTVSERYLLPLFLLQPVRCSECFRRDYRALFIPVKERLPEPAKKLAASVPPANRNVA